MTELALSDRRLPALESLRALAAFQVLLLHLFSAFLPAIVFDRPESSLLGVGIHRSLLFYFYDGYSAVYIFFVLSGYVLTAPFVRDAARPGYVLVARWVRLAVPALAACIFAAAVMALLPRAHIAAGAALNSDWLSGNWLPLPGPLAFWRDYLDSLFIGYQDGTIVSFGFSPPWLPGIQTAYVPPLWTIGIEFAGSIVVFVLAAIRGRLPRLWLAAVIIAGIVFLRTPYLCFILGHVAAVGALAEKPSRVPPWLCILGVAVGVLLCVVGERYTVPGVQAVCDLDFPLLNCDTPLHFQKRLGSLLIFLSLITWQDARNLLSSQALARLGRISFPVYLVHWPIVFGPSCVVYLAVAAAGAPPLMASLAAILIGIGLTLVVALPFARVDAAAQALSRVVRRGGGVRSSVTA